MNKMKKILVFSLAALLLVAVGVGGTLAYLTDKTDEVKNTFVATGIDISLTETMKPEGEGTLDGEWKAAMIPGKTYNKNPIVEINTDVTTVPIYLFVKFDESQVPSGLTYDSTLYDVTGDTKTATNGWTQGTGDIPADVWYRAWDPATDSATYSWPLLEKNQVSIGTGVEKNANNQIGGGSLTWKAYAIQQFGFESPSAAWTEVAKLDTAH